MKKYSPYENCSCHDLVHRPKVKSQESYRPDKTQGLCDPWSRGYLGWALVRTFPTGSSTRLQYSTASQTATKSYEDTINHVSDKKSGRGGWERRRALAGFHRTCTVHVQCSCANHSNYFEKNKNESPPPPLWLHLLACVPLSIAMGSGASA